MAKDFIGHELRIRDFVTLPAAFGRGLRFGVVFFADLDDDRVSIFTDDQKIVHSASDECLRLSDKSVPGLLRKQLTDGMIGVFHPKETE